MSNATQDQPRRKTTYDLGIERLTMAEWEDPADLPKRKTTYDLALEQLTVEYPRDEVGATQVMGGTTFRFDGAGWVITEKH